MKAGCSLDLFFHQQLFPLWPLNLNFPYQIIVWFPMTVLAFPSPHSHPGICCSHDLSLQLFYFMCWFDSQSFFFCSCGIHNSLLSSYLPPSPVALPAAPWVPPVTSGSFTLLQGLAKTLAFQLSVTVAQASIPILSLPYAFSLLRSIELVDLRYLMCLVLLVSLFLFIVFFCSYFSLWLLHSPPLSLFLPFSLYTEII